MRLWHKDLIACLPDDYLLVQWEDCLTISQNILDHGDVGQKDLYRIQKFSYLHFLTYGYKIIGECIKRDLEIGFSSIYSFERNILSSVKKYGKIKNNVTNENVFKGWQNLRYYKRDYKELNKYFEKI